MYTIDASTCTPITYPMKFAFDDSYNEEEIESLDLAKGDFVNLLLYRTASEEAAGKDPTILGCVPLYDASYVADIEDDSAESNYFYEIELTSLCQTPLYNAFSNSLSAVTGVYNLIEDNYVMDHAAPYYKEDGNDDESSEGDYTLISTIEYDQGVLCDIPGQNAMDDEETTKATTLTAWVYQDATIQDVQNREYYMPVISTITQIEEESGQRNFIDPLYHSYLIVGMSDDHYTECDLPKHYYSNGDGTHTVLCDDYIIHDQAEECVDEDGNLCSESGKPCVHCGWAPDSPEPDPDPDPDPDPTPEPDDDDDDEEETSSATTTPKTGDDAPLGAAAAVAVAAAGAAAVVAANQVSESAQE